MARTLLTMYNGFKVGIKAIQLLIQQEGSEVRGKRKKKVVASNHSPLTAYPIPSSYR